MAVNRFKSSNEYLQQLAETGFFFADNANIDAFGRLRVSNPFTLWDSKQVFDDVDIANNLENQPLFWDNQEISGSGTSTEFRADEASTRLSVGNLTAGRRVRQTKQRFNYQPGKSMLVVVTGVLGDPADGVTKAFGYFDDNNGFCLERTGSITRFLKRSSITGSPVDETFDQADWNIDKMDGNGPSGVNLDFVNSQIFFTDFEWLGVGRIRLGFFIGGVPIVAHQILNANVRPTAYMTTANLPVRYLIENDGTGASAFMDSICSTVISEGGIDKNGIIRTHSTGNTHLDATTVDEQYSVLGIRLRPTHLGATINLIKMSMISETENDNFRWFISLNPTIAGTFTFSNLANSAVQVATGVTANTITDPGTVMGGGFASNDTQQFSDELESALRLGSFIDGTPDELVLGVTPLSPNADIQAELTWRELI